ncbi:hypothetical protein Agabi119p4_9743 [Agaricus bisporus var. burnettii]|uniref:Uncharacterized protein n=1 Tax=Agaricus bisporus var. burnettii TaxID=192524 RepID=A0A8H7C4C4_AGABI|nr:hypothetical protein Agabi119p4_9743 [Agaricus bisporus var. burnettii]
MFHRTHSSSSPFTTSSDAINLDDFSFSTQHSKTVGDIDFDGQYDESFTDSDGMDYIEVDGRRFPDFQNQEGLHIWQAENPDCIHPWLWNVSPRQLSAYLPMNMKDVEPASLQDIPSREQISKAVAQDEMYGGGVSDEESGEPVKQERGVMTNVDSDRKHQDQHICIRIPVNSNIKLTISVEGKGLALAIDGIVTDST